MAKKNTEKTVFKNYEVVLTSKGQELSRRTLKAKDPLHAMGQAFTLLNRFTDNRDIPSVKLNWKEID